MLVCGDLPGQITWNKESRVKKTPSHTGCEGKEVVLLLIILMAHLYAKRHFATIPIL